RALADGGCAPLLVVVGAGSEEVTALVAGDARVVTAPDWADGMGASLRAGLAALSGSAGAGIEAAAEQRPVDAALVHLVDLPGVGPSAIARLCAVCDGPDVLVRAGYQGKPGHPVLLGRSHWDGVRAAATGDVGARDYLAGHPALRLVECGDIADPRDVDTPGALAWFAAGGAGVSSTG
ncbi:MAG: NTP transferase domain-containing protein, partial [Pseudonocardiales bacterium]|nr:NTP transferase domain-containing protein [Pseudonocardiales bacterium]